MIASVETLLESRSEVAVELRVRMTSPFMVGVPGAYRPGLSAARSARASRFSCQAARNGALRVVKPAALLEPWR